MASYRVLGWKNQAISSTMATAGMTISRNATMLTAMPRTRKASAANTAVITTTATAATNLARLEVELSRLLLGPSRRSEYASERRRWHGFARPAIKNCRALLARIMLVIFPVSPLGMGTGPSLWHGPNSPAKADIGCRRGNSSLGVSIRLEAADACSKKLIVELAKPSGLLVKKKRKECISAAQCDARNRVQQRAWKYDCAARRRLEFSRPVFRKA
jgi:hypothetical protein